MKKIVSVLLLLVMLFSLFACTGNKDTNPDGTPNYSKYAPKVKDLGGMDFVMAVCNPSNVYMDEYDGTSLGQAVCDKIYTTEKDYNVDISIAVHDLSEDARNAMLASVANGSNDYQLFSSWNGHGGPMSLEGAFRNYLALPHFNFDAPWWPKNELESMTVNGAAFLMANFLNYDGVAYASCVVFGKDVMDEHGITYPYQLVLDGDWTLDKMYEMTEGIYQDIDDVAGVSDGDRFAYMFNGNWESYIECFDFDVFGRDENGAITYTFDQAKFQTIVDKLAQFTSNNRGPLLNKHKANAAMAEGRALFLRDGFWRVPNVISKGTANYGILPVPKLDENQEDYIGCHIVQPGAIFVTVPEKDLDNVCLITEVLNMKGYTEVYPAYFETGMKSRYSPDNLDAQMLDICVQNNYCSLAFMLNIKTNPQAIMSNTFTYDGTKADWVSYYEANKDIDIETIKTLNEQYKKAAAK